MGRAHLCTEEGTARAPRRKPTTTHNNIRGGQGRIQFHFLGRGSEIPGRRHAQHARSSVFLAFKRNYGANKLPPTHTCARIHSCMVVLRLLVLISRRRLCRVTHTVHVPLRGVLLISDIGELMSPSTSWSYTRLPPKYEVGVTQLGSRAATVAAHHRAEHFTKVSTKDIPQGTWSPCTAAGLMEFAAPCPRFTEPADAKSKRGSTLAS